MRSGYLTSNSKARDVKDTAAAAMAGMAGCSYALNLQDWIEANIIQTQVTLETCTDVHSMYRAQGAVTALRNLLYVINPQK